MNLKFFRQYGLTIVVSLFIMYMCLMPADDMPNTGWFLSLLPDFIAENFDKVVHFGFYVILSIAVGSDFYRQRVNYGTKKMYIWALAYPILLGGLIEILQETMTNTRSGDWIDLTADILGAVVGYFVGKLLLPRFVERERAGIC